MSYYKQKENNFDDRILPCDKNRNIAVAAITEDGNT